MKLTSFPFIAAVIVSVLSVHYGSALALDTSCAMKEKDIQAKINYAKKFDNKHKVASLELALAEVKLHCSDAGEQKKRELHLGEKQRKVTEMALRLTEKKQALDEAIAYGDSRRIVKQQKRYESGQRALEEAKVKLSDAQNAPY